MLSERAVATSDQPLLASPVARAPMCVTIDLVTTCPSCRSADIHKRSDIIRPINRIDMSFGRPGGFSDIVSTPPDRGAFPLDHYGTSLALHYNPSAYLWSMVGDGDEECTGRRWEAVYSDIISS